LENSVQGESSSQGSSGEGGGIGTVRTHKGDPKRAREESRHQLPKDHGWGEVGSWEPGSPSRGGSCSHLPSREMKVEDGCLGQ
jgi:hypothetical protein